MNARRTAGPATIRRILELTCRAPSVHNTQPWLWRVTGSRVDLYADPTRQLLVADADGRNLTISCGAALHHVRIAAAAAGLRARVTRMPDPENLRHLASIEIVPGRRPAHATSDLRALERRCTDRRRFTSWPIAENRIAGLVSAVPEDGVHIASIAGASERFRLELLLSRAKTQQDADSRFAAEQQEWISHSPVDGIPAAVVGGSDYPRSRPSRFEHHRSIDVAELVQSSDGVLVLGTATDDPDAWLRTGEALSALWLRATTEGLSVVPLSQVIEVEETRIALQHDLLDGLMTPQILARIGWQQISRSEQPRSPRRPLDDVLLS